MGTFQASSISVRPVPSVPKLPVTILSAKPRAIGSRASTDALQDGLINACTRLRTFEGRSSFSSWLTRIVINAALMIRRKKKAHPEASLDEILDTQSERFPRGAVDLRSDPEKIYAANEIRALVEKQVRKLPSEMQLAYRLRAVNGLSTAESCWWARSSQDISIKGRCHVRSSE